METVDFVRESNRIEGINKEPTKGEMLEHDRFIDLAVVTAVDLKRFVAVYQPNARIRNRIGMNVRVGSYAPKPGSEMIPILLEELLDDIEEKTPYQAHVEYELLHPFTDGNGRSGRALWAWHMIQNKGNYNLGFLHHFYYQSLDAARKI
jgi:fido (protein-threonine AMPylation protein)